METMVSSAPVYAFVGIYLLSAIVALVFGSYVVYRGENDRTFRVYGILMGAIALWSTADAVQLLSESLTGKLNWMALSYVGIVTVPVAFVIFALYYSGRGRFVRLESVFLLSIVPVVTMAQVIKTPEHQFFHTSNKLLSFGGKGVLVWKAGPGFWVHTVYSYLLLGIGVVLLIQFALTTERLYRIQTVSLLSGTVIPIFGNALFLIGVTPFPMFDLTPPIFALSSLFIFVSITYGQFGNIRPVARGSVLNTFEDGVLVIDRQDRVIYLNRASRTVLAESTHGTARDQLIGTPLSDVFPVITAVESEQPEDEHTEFEASLRRNGENRWFWIRRLTVEQNGAGSTVVTITEITDRKVRQRKARKIQELARELMRIENRKTLANTAVRTTMDAFSLSMIGIYFRNDSGGTLQQVAFESVTESEHRLESQFAREEEGRISQTTWNAFEDESSFVISGAEVAKLSEALSVSPEDTIVHPLGSHGVFIFSVRANDSFDTTDVVLLRILASTVTAALDQVQSTEKLKAKQKELRQQNERLAEFTDVVSHDLRSPLNTFEGMVELLQTEYDDSRIDRIEEASQRMDELVGDLLTLARQGEAVNETVSVDLSGVIQRAWNSIPATGVTLSIEFDERVVEADSSRLQQALENIFRNALDHGGSVSEIRVGWLQNSEGFYVEDDGEGISESEDDRLFESGYSTEETGTGLGLAIVNRIIEAHGWNISAQGGRDGGARFEITDVEVTNE